MSWFTMWVELSTMAREWQDWSEDGLFRYSVVVRSAVQMSLFCERHCPGGMRRWPEDKLVWAVQWLSNPAGKAVSHV